MRMRRSVCLLLLTGLLAVVIGVGVPVRAELGLGGGLGLYPLELAQLKGHLEGLGMPPEALAAIPNVLPLPHLAVRLQLMGLQLAFFALKYERLLAQDTGLRLITASLAANLEVPLQLQLPLFMVASGLGLSLLGGEVSLTADDASLDSALAQLGLRRLAWVALNGHALGEVALALGPLRFYLLGRYLLPLLQLSQGLIPGNWELELGLFLAL